MAGQLIFLDKNRADPDFAEASTYASELDDLSEKVVDRKNISAWITEASLDANNTYIELRFGRVTPIDFLLLILHNFKAANAKYWNEDTSAFSNLLDEDGVAISWSGLTDALNTTFYRCTPVNTSIIRITITGTITANDAKRLTQFIATEEIWTLEGWPMITDTLVGRDVDDIDMADGLGNVIDRQGRFSCKLSVSPYTLQDDVDALYSLYNRVYGFLLWPCGGDEDQFTPLTEGSRLEDIYLGRFTTRFSPERFKGIYPGGINWSAKFRETNE